MYIKQFEFLKKFSRECVTDHGPIDLTNFTIRGRGLPFFSFYHPYSVVYKPVYFDEPTYHPNLVSYWKSMRLNSFFVNLAKIDDSDTGLIYFEEPNHQIKSNQNQNLNISKGFKLINIDWLVVDVDLRRQLVSEICIVNENIWFDNRNCLEEENVVAPVNYDGNGTLLYSEAEQKIHCFDVLAPRRIKKDLLFMGWAVVERDQDLLKIMFLKNVTNKQIQQCIEYNIAEQRITDEKFNENTVSIDYRMIEVYDKNGTNLNWKCIDSGEIDEKQMKLYSHPLITGENIRTIEQLRVFMEHHVFAVWDFMSLLKTLQREICPARHPWMPNKYTENGTARLINDIVIAEESDLSVDGNYMSHFEMYLSAMEEIGADTQQIKGFLEYVKANGIDDAVEWLIGANQVAGMFIKSTMDVIKNQHVCCVAASFAYGRETSIPDMFLGIMSKLKIEKDRCPAFYYYMERHIDLDSGEHGPASLVLVNTLTEFNLGLINSAEKSAGESIEHRIRFWDGIYDKLK